jgi:hypothetical protein
LNYKEIDLSEIEMQELIQKNSKKLLKIFGKEKEIS